MANRKPLSQILAVASALVLGLVVGTFVGIAISEDEAQAQIKREMVKKDVSKIQKVPMAKLILLKYEGLLVEMGSKDPIVGVDVTLTGPKTYTAKTDTDGIFRFNGVYPGEYKVSTRDCTKVLDMQNILYCIEPPR